VSTDQNKELNELMSDLAIQTQEPAENNMLDLAALQSLHAGNLEAFKNARADMVAKRDAIKKAIKIIDKRIEIAVATIKVLTTPV
jgi:hypothetical protein